MATSSHDGGGPTPSGGSVLPDRLRTSPTQAARERSARPHGLVGRLRRDGSGRNGSMGQRQGTKGALAHLADLGQPPHQRRLAAHEITCLRFRSVGGNGLPFEHLIIGPCRILVHARPTQGGGSQPHRGRRKPGPVCAQRNPGYPPAARGEKGYVRPTSAASSPQKRDTTPPRPKQTARAAS